AYGIRAEIYSADLNDATAVQNIIPAATAAFGHVDILINNAAIFPEEDSFTTTDLALWDELFRINLRAPFLLCQAFAAQRPSGQPGCIVNVLDARVRRPYPDHFAYRLSKGTLWQMTEMLAHELAPPITVNGVALGAILPPPGKEQDYLDNLAQARVPLQRPGSAEIVAQNVLHLLRQDFLTGVILPIDGGEFL
ncbi:MAG: SDR family oxidoreductase, partial [Anaerolineae bacterium]|nr:SDR family oxidoreductase [Anaerolineae bacterium]